MAYGILKVDNITFDNGGSDQNVTVSGLYRATTSGVTVSGTIAAGTVSGVTVIGSTTVSGATVTGTTANFTSGNFSNIISSAATMSGALIMANQQQVQFREAVGNGVNHIALQAPAIVSADQVITLPDETGTIVTTGDNGSVTSTMLATNLTISAAAGSAAAPSIAFTGDLNTGIYSPGANQVAVATNETGRLFVDSAGNIGLSEASPTARLHLSGTNTAGGIKIVDSSSSAAAPGIEVIGKRGDANISPAFAGKLLLSKNRTDAAISSNNVLGSVAFGGNHTDGTEANILYSASIVGAADGAFNSATDMPTALVFNTGATGRAPDTANVTAGTERLRIDSSGRLLVGTSTSVWDGLIEVARVGGSQFVGHRYGTNAFPSELNFLKSRGASVGTNTILADGDSIGNINFRGADGSSYIPCAQISAAVDGTPGSNDMPGSLIFSTTSDGNSSPTDRMQIDSDGDVHIASTGVDITSSSSNGFTFRSGGAVVFARAGSTTVLIGRNTDDGALVGLYQGGTQEGTISVAGATVSYNPFLGSHWGRLADGSKPDILPGTILDTVDQLIEWKQAKFTVDGEEKIAAYNGPAEVGDTVAIDYEGTSYSAIVQNEEEEPEELNKHVCVKVNDTASSKAVFGVFLGWDHDIPDGMVSTWNDLYCAAVGNYFVRIADGETLEIGSLIEADGNGCGIVQDDDIIRSKTVAKITSTIPQKVYDDGSFLVTCVLCCG